MPSIAKAFLQTFVVAGLIAGCSYSKRDTDDSQASSSDLQDLTVQEATASAAPVAGEASSSDEVDPYALPRERGQHKAEASTEQRRTAAATGRAIAKSAPATEYESHQLAEDSDRDGSDPYASSPAPTVANPGKGKRDKASENASGSTRREHRCLSLDCMPEPPYRHPPRPAPVPPRYSEPESEEYAPIHENAFLDAQANPLSTFSIDVDGASYANVRRFLQENRLPPRDAVRIEELINNFSFDYPKPQGADPFTITTESATTPWNPDTRLVLIGLQGRSVAERNLPPSNLVFLIDVSGSMASPDKLPLLKDAFDMLTDRLRREDRISIVVYAGAAGMVLPPTRGDDKEAIREALGRLEAGGSTAGGAGLMLAYQAAQSGFIKGGNNRVILATDGDFNVGLSGDDELVRFIENKRKTGVYLSVLGFGTGNIKDAKMEQLANKGNGNYFYIDNIHEARKVLVEKMAGTLHAIAKDVKLQVEFNPSAVRSYRLIGYENRVLAAEDFNDDRKDAGELGVGHSVTALYEVVPARPPRPKVDPLKYQDGGYTRGRGWFRGEEGPDAGELLTVKFRYKRPNSDVSRLLSRVLKNRERTWRDASENFRFASAVAGFGLLLRDSRYRGDLGYDFVISLARGAKGKDLNGDRAEFVHLAHTAKLLGETDAYGMPEAYR